MKSLKRGELYYFECDMRGKNTKCCGALNSNAGFERPFLILTIESRNKGLNNDDIYAVPLSKRGEGNSYSINIVEEMLENRADIINLTNSVIMCDRICRITEKNLWSKRDKKIGKITDNYCRSVRKNILQFITDVL